MARVLLVGPDRARGREIHGLLVHDGHRVQVHPAVSGWRDREREIAPEVVVAAVETADLVLAEIRAPGHGFPAPLLFVQRESDAFAETEIDLDERLVDRLVSPFAREDLLARVDALVRVRRVVLRGNGATPPVEAAPDAVGRLRLLGRRLVDALRGPVVRHEHPLEPYHEVASRVARWADWRDAFEPGHAERVTELCSLMAETLELDDRETSTLLRAALLHDIGKVALPVEMLHQKGPLDDGQMRMIRLHPKRGAALTRALGRDHEVANVILHHHERPDGRGYYGVAGADVPLNARILAVAEVFDAMTSTRLARRVTPHEALERLDASKGIRLDAGCVDALAERIAPRGGPCRWDPVPLAP